MNIQGVIILEKELKKISALHCQVLSAPVRLKTAWLFPLLLRFSPHSTCGKPVPRGPYIWESPGGEGEGGGTWIPRAPGPERGRDGRAGAREGTDLHSLCRMDPPGDRPSVRLSGPIEVGCRGAGSSELWSHHGILIPHPAGTTGSFLLFSLMVWKEPG